MIERILLRLFPAAWRKEYGEEFADVLSLGPIGIGTVADVVWSAAGQRWRYAPLWSVMGAYLFVLSLTSIWLRYYSILPRDGRITTSIINVTLTLTAFFIAAGKESSFAAGVVGTSKAGLCAAAPGFLLSILWTPASQSITMMDHTWQITSGITAVVLTPIVAAAYSASLGTCGALGGRLFVRLRRLTA